MFLLSSRAGPLSLTGLFLSSAVSGYVWPDPKVDMVEFQLYEQQGFNFIQYTSFAEVILPPNEFVDPVEGSNRAAMWLRVAYHDMATHNKTDGTGGLDGSIVFETGRAENTGNAFVITIGDLSGATSTRCSFSDNLAIAAIVTAGITTNGSVIVPFWGGRIDAIEAGPMGVPEPQQDLATHTDKFANQGFNVSEMIALVACGHSIGGVHGIDFPTIVPIPANASDDPFNQFTQEFDSDTGVFNNKVASQFVANETQNALAFGANETTRSDARIFMADGGDMISRMAASNEFYLDTCKELIGRMVNTVPKDVTLIDISKPYVVKPIQLYATVNSNGTMTVSGIIRLLNDIDTPFAPTGDDKRKVVVHLSPRGGSMCSSTQNCTAVTATTRDIMIGGAGYPGLAQFVYYAFETEVPASQGVSSFIVETIDKASGVSTIHDNEGHGFPFQDAIIPQKPKSCRVMFGDNGAVLNLTVAVRDAPQYTAVDLSIPVPSPLFSVIPSQWVTSTVAMQPAATVDGTDYTLFTGTFTNPFTRAQPTGHPYDVTASGDGVRAEALFYPWSDLPSC